MRLLAVLAATVSALVLAAGASARPVFGVADDSGKYAGDGGARFFSALNDLGMTEDRVTVTWDPSRPSTIVEQAFLDRSVRQAAAHRIDLVFAIFPAKARALADTPNGVQLFAQFAAQVARRYPQVKKIVCLNEGNQTRFQQPQYDDAGNGVAGTIQEAAMAACYDALKAVDPAIDVIGFGFSPRGNDDPDAPSNVSHSPLLFLKEIGAAYRASGRQRPIADDVSVHCYPRANTDAPSVGFHWPNVGCANLDRFKQAWWDAFHGTAQPLFRETGSPDGGRNVRFFVDEAGYQARVPQSEAGAYTGTENVPALDDATQGAYYAKLIQQTACDPDMALFNIFHLVDERSLLGWQSGLMFADWTPRGSYAAVKAALAAAGNCDGAVHGWRHANHVVAARFALLRHARYVSVSADEGFSYTVSVSRGKRVLASATGAPATGTTAVVKVAITGHGHYRIRVQLHAATNDERTSTFVRSVTRR